jgi:peptidase C39-like protein
MGETLVQGVARRIDDVGWCIEIGFANLKMDDVAALGLERSRLHKYFESSLGPETRRTLREAKFVGLNHDGEISIIAALAQLVFFFDVAITRRVWFQNLLLREPPLQFLVLKRRWPFFIFGFVLLLLIAGLALQIDWTWKRKLSPRGGRYFFHRVELAVPSFRQSEEKWRDDPLGGVEANGTLGGEGCAVAAAAMVFKFYGIELDPQQLNWFLTSVGGYTEQGWIYWDRAAWFAPGRVRHVYEDLASYHLIDSNLSRGNPVIVRVRLPGGVTHFVVIAGKEGFDYLIADPGAGSARGLYPLRELGSDIEGLRFYEPITTANSQLAVKQ